MLLSGPLEVHIPINGARDGRVCQACSPLASVANAGIRKGEA